MSDDINTLYLNFKEEKDLFKKVKYLISLRKEKDLSLIEISKNIDLSPSYLSHMIRLNKLPELIVDGYYSSLISVTHLYIISRLKNIQDMIDVYEKVLSKNLTTLQTDELVRDYLYSIKSEGEYLTKDEKKQIIERLDLLNQTKLKIIQTRIKSRLIFEIKGSLKETTEKLRKIFQLLNTNK